MIRFESEILKELSKVFKNDSQPLSTLHKIIDDFIKITSSPEKADIFLNGLISSLKISPRPKQSLTNLIRFIENSTSKVTLYNDFTRYPQVLKILITIFGFSQFFADILVRDPELFRWITSTDALDKFLTKQDYVEQINQTLRAFSTLERKLNALRRFKRREILRIGLRDIFRLASFEETTLSLSNLADAIIETLLSLTIQVLREKYGLIPKTEFCIIALGKLGGQELNYSSDVDLIFIYNEDGEIENRGKKISYYEFFNQLVSLLIKFLSEKTEEGYLYRADFRLRPEGKFGSLARSFLGYLTYYEIYGEIWERQMLIKARPIAGDLNFGNKFLNTLDSFIYPKSFNENPIEIISRIKARIEASSSHEYNIKLRKGGIRDIEFLVQTLQLLNAGNIPELKERNTLKAIEKLQNFGLLPKKVSDFLRESYIYFRRIEHLLQISYDTQTHTLKFDAPDFSEISAIAKAMKFYEMRSEKVLIPELFPIEWRTFKKKLDERFSLARQIFETYMATEPKPEFIITELFSSEEVTQDKIFETLKTMRFRNIDVAMRNLEFLLHGRLITGEVKVSSADKKVFMKLALILLNEISETVNPDITLENIRKIAEGLNYSRIFYELIQIDSYRDIMLKIAQYSPRFSRLISLKPHLLELLFTNDNLHKSTEQIFENFVKGNDQSVNFFKHFNSLRLLVLNLSGGISFDELAKNLTLQADLILKYFYAILSTKKNFYEVSNKIAIMGLGKFGSEEMNFDSDIDMIIVSEKMGTEEFELATKFCETLIEMMTQLEIEKLYTIDVRLRPEGRNAPLLSEIHHFQRYLEQRAELWEILALTKLRFVAGNKNLSEKILTILKNKLNNIQITKFEAERLFDLRIKMQEQVKRENIDIKLSEGGIADIDFIAQFLQIKNFKKLNLVEKNTPRAIQILADKGIIQQNHFETLLSNYYFFREIEKFLRVALDTKSNLIPKKGNKLEYLSLCIGFKDMDEFFDSVQKRMKRTREIFESLILR